MPNQNLSAAGQPNKVLGVASQRQTGALIGPYIGPFILGLGGSVFLHPSARVSLLEIGILIVFGIGLINYGVAFRGLKSYSITGLLLIFGMVLSLSIHGGTTNYLVDPLANYAMLCILVLGLASFLQKNFRVRLTSVLLGAGVGQFVGMIISPTDEIIIDPWKFGLGYGFSIIALVGLGRLFQRGMPLWMVSVAVLFLACIHLWQGTRSLAGATALVGVLLFVRNFRKTSHRFRLGMFALIGLSTTAFALEVYGQLASSGALGLEAEGKWHDQTGELGIIPGARKEILLLLVAWLNSPFWGWGPRASVDDEVISTLYRWYISHGYEISARDYSRLFQVESIPLHSVMLGMLVQAGVFATPLVVVLTRHLLRALAHSLTYAHPASIFVVLTAMMHFVVSPLGDITRFPIALAVALGLVTWQAKRRSRMRPLDSGSFKPEIENAVSGSDRAPSE